MIYIAYKKELDKILFYEKKSKALMTKVQQEKEQLQAQIVQQKAQINTEEQKLKLMKKQLEEVIAREQPCDLERFDLTSREREILELLVTAKSTNKEIADVLGVKEDTV
ncbi:MAG: hypothetical protein KAR21_08630, partial [Spirochaetales bacterium]|nr:hypothetical protein [Spirochaetales bacterium]